MAWMNRLTTVSAALMAISFASGAGAQVFIDFEQVGGDVVGTVTGTFDRRLAPSAGPSGGFGGYLGSSVAFFGIGAPGGVDDFYTTGAPQSFGSVVNFIPYTSTSGTSFGMNGGFGSMFIGERYVNNSQISTTALFSNTTLATLGLNPAIYNFAAGGNAIRLIIGQTVTTVADAATWAMMLAGFGSVGMALRLRRTSARTLIVG